MNAKESSRRLWPSGSQTCAGHESKIGGNELVRSFATTPIDLSGNCINQVAV
jgi:hypothetical protein